MNDFTRHILTEVYGYYTNSIINEATMAQDVYTKFYEDQLPLEDFMKVVMLDPTSKKTKNGYTKGAFLPWLMEHYDEFYIKKYYQLLKDSMQIFVTIRNSANDLTPQDFVGDINEYNSYRSLINEMEDMSAQYEFNKANKRGTQTIKGFPEFKIIPDLCNVEFTGKYWTVISPTCREGGIYYGHGTEWCTAMTGNNLKKDYYNGYLGEYGGKYYILFNSVTQERYQLHFENGTNGMFCDKYDDPIQTWDEMCHTPEERDEILHFFQQVRGENLDPEYLSKPDFNYDDFKDWLEYHWDGNIDTFRQSVWGRRNDSPVTIYTFGDFVVFSFKETYFTTNILTNLKNYRQFKQLSGFSNFSNTLLVINQYGEFLIVDEDRSYFVYDGHVDDATLKYKITSVRKDKGLITFQIRGNSISIPINALNNTYVFDMFITNNLIHDFLSLENTVLYDNSTAAFYDASDLSVTIFNPESMINILSREYNLNQETAIEQLEKLAYNLDSWENMTSIIKQNGNTMLLKDIINNRQL